MNSRLFLASSASLFLLIRRQLGGWQESDVAGKTGNWCLAKDFLFFFCGCRCNFSSLFFVKECDCNMIVSLVVLPLVKNADLSKNV